MKKKIITVILSIIFVISGWVLYINKPQYTLSIAAIMKNEKPYLKEWIEYHRLQGVEHFYLCDNDSTDQTKEYLQPYIKRGVVTYLPLPGKNRQLDCYEKIITSYKKETKWLAIIDLDEFLVPIEAKNMQDFLKKFDDVSEVSLHWLNYGDNSAVKRPNGLVTEFFTSHGRFLNHTVKSIVKPNDVIDFKSFGANHYMQVKGKSVNENHDPVKFMLGFYPSAKKARINHYIVKSYAEFLYKKKRGHPEGTPIDYDYYFFHNENEIKDDQTMQRFLPLLKKRMQESPLADVDVPTIADLPDDFSQIYYTPEEATMILNQKIDKTLNFNEITAQYKNNHPNYKNKQNSN